MNGAGAPALTGTRPELRTAFKRKKINTGKVCKKIAYSLIFNIGGTQSNDGMNRAYTPI